MATRFMCKALATAALGIALSLLLAATTTASPASINTAGALQLDPPAAPSHLRTTKWYDRRERETFLSVNWSDNSTNEDGFTVEVWHDGVLAWSENMPSNSTGTGYIFFGRQAPHYRFRVKAFNASGDSSWSNWAH